MTELNNAGFPLTPTDVASAATQRAQLDPSQPMILSVMGAPGQEMAVVRFPDGRIARMPLAEVAAAGGAQPLATASEELLSGVEAMPAGLASFAPETSPFPVRRPSDTAPAPASATIPSLIQSESGGNWQAQNDVPGAGGTGHFGRLQFSRARLADAIAAGVLPAGTTPEQFMADPALQVQAENWHFGDINRFITGQGLERYEGQTILGIPVTRGGMQAVAHLGGNSGLRRFLESGGQYNPSDRFGTSLASYLRQHAGPGVAAQAPSEELMTSSPAPRPRPPAPAQQAAQAETPPAAPRNAVEERFQQSAAAPAPRGTQSPATEPLAPVQEPAQRQPLFERIREGFRNFGRTPENPDASLGERLMQGFDEIGEGLEDLPDALQYLELFDNSSQMRVPAPPPIYRPRGGTGTQAVRRLGLESLA